MSNGQSTLSERDQLKLDSYKFWMKLSKQLQAGVDLNEAVVEAVIELSSPRFRQVGEKVRLDLQRGIPLDEALGKYPEFFAKGVISLIRTGIQNNQLAQMAGNVAKGLSAVASHLQAQENLKAGKKQKELEISERYEKRRERIKQWLLELFTAALERGASHIHLEPVRGAARVRLCCLGLMEPYQDIPQDDYDSILFGIKKMCNLFTMGGVYPQHGQFFTRVDGKHIDMTMVVSLYHFGESIVIRIFDRSAELPAMAELGMSREQLLMFKQWARKDAGLILFCGPSSSGKSTTMFSFLENMQGRKLKLGTVEKNLQFVLPDVNHLRIKPDANLDYVQAISVQCEFNLNCLAVDVIREGSVAVALAEAASLGMLTLGTIRAAGAPEGLHRFQSFGVGAHRIHDVVIGAVGQRLVRKNCVNCREAIELNDEEKRSLEAMNLQLDGNFCRGKGCPECGRTGSAGAIAFFEIMAVDDTVIAAIARQEGSRHVRRAAVESGCIDLRLSGFDLVCQGLVSPSEFIRNTSGVYLD
ncbi:ATPase, T2SS/T4P/T4SS family [Planctomycetota bacterium]